MGFLFFHFKYPKRALGGGEKRSPTGEEIAGDELSGPTRERGNGDRRRCDLL